MSQSSHLSSLYSEIRLGRRSRRDTPVASNRGDLLRIVIYAGLSSNLLASTLPSRYGSPRTIAAWKELDVLLTVWTVKLHIKLPGAMDNLERRKRQFRLTFHHRRLARIICAFEFPVMESQTEAVRTHLLPGANWWPQYPYGTVHLGHHHLRDTFKLRCPIVGLYLIYPSLSVTEVNRCRLLRVENRQKIVDSNDWPKEHSDPLQSSEQAKAARIHNGHNAFVAQNVPSILIGWTNRDKTVPSYTSP